MSYQTNIDRAKKIVEIVASKLNVNVDDVIAGRHNGDVPYARRLSVYLIRNNTSIKHQDVAALVGFKRQNNSMIEYRRVMDQCRLSQEVRYDVVFLENIINNLLAA